MSLPAILPQTTPKVRGAMAIAWRGLRAVSRAHLETDRPICQIFINGQGKRTVYTLINFPSLFAPSAAAACSYDLVLYDADGGVVARKRVSVPALGTLEVRPEQIFSERLPELGLLSVQIVAGSRFCLTNRNLGPVRAHFYALYHDEGMASMAVVHPQSIMWAERQISQAWRSNLIIFPKKLDRIELYQINPTPIEMRTDLNICALDDSELFSSAALMPPRGARKVSWDTSNLHQHDYVVVASNGLTAPNAKPLLFQHNNSGFSASHA